MVGWDLIRVDEFREGCAQVVRVEGFGIDLDKDVDIGVVDGMVRINVEGRVEFSPQPTGRSFGLRRG